MSLFGRAAGGQQTLAQPPIDRLPPEMQHQLRQVKADPADFIKQQYGLNVQGNDPMQILNSLAQSGQLNSRQMQIYQRVQQMQRMGRR